MSSQDDLEAEVTPGSPETGGKSRYRRAVAWVIAAVVVLVGGGVFVYEQTKVAVPTGSGSSAQTYASEGVAAFDSDQYQVALGLFTREIGAATTTAGKALGYFNRGDAYDALHRYDMAIDDFRSSVSLNAKDQNAWLDLGILEQRQGNASAALGAYRKILALNPTSAGALFNEGVLLYQGGSRAQGLADINKAISIDPKLVTQVPSDIKLK